MAPKQLPDDFREFIECLNKHEDGVEISVISKADLVRNKRATGRLRDLADAEAIDDE
jgi:hypothetical protein